MSSQWSETLSKGAFLLHLKVAQINYVSRNQLHCTANFNFGLMCKKAKHSWALSTNFFISVQLIVFLDHVLLLADLVQKFKIAVRQSDPMKRNFRGFTLTKLPSHQYQRELNIVRITNLIVNNNKVIIT